MTEMTAVTGHKAIATFPFVLSEGMAVLCCIIQVSTEY